MQGLVESTMLGKAVIITAWDGGKISQVGQCIARKSTEQKPYTIQFRDKSTAQFMYGDFVILEHMKDVQNQTATVPEHLNHKTAIMTALQKAVNLLVNKVFDLQEHITNDELMYQDLVIKYNQLAEENNRLNDFIRRNEDYLDGIIT